MPLHPVVEIAIPGRVAPLGNDIEPVIGRPGQRLASGREAVALAGAGLFVRLQRAACLHPLAFGYAFLGGHSVPALLQESDVPDEEHGEGFSTLRRYG